MAYPKGARFHNAFTPAIPGEPSFRFFGGSSTKRLLANRLNFLQRVSQRRPNPRLVRPRLCNHGQLVKPRWTSQNTFGITTGGWEPVY